MKVVVAGWVAGFPVAGFLWHPVSFALGFRELGHDVWFLDDAGDAPFGYDPETDEVDPDCHAGVRFLQREMADLGLDGRWVFRHVPQDRFEGMDRETTMDVLAEADVFVNVSMTCPMRPEYRAIPHRLAIDTDPVFNQIRIAQGDEMLGSVPETHTRLFTFGRPPLPAQRHEWVPTRQPVSTICWPPADDPPCRDQPLTTVTAWHAYDVRTWDGRDFGMKDRSIRRYVDLPRRTEQRLAIALGGGDGEAMLQGERLLRDHGWEQPNAIESTLTTERYRTFMRRSLGELGFAKHGYVAARSGWFSERTCYYMASGRPAIVQDTGWRDWLPDGDGLLAFSTPEDAVSAIEEVAAHPERHGAAARRLVEEHFDAAEVCGRLLEGAL
ncbi:MAG: glycosyltransferase [Actinobacteria bacterium]|nr:glycosyltransferase [Actinomycetota bacterium]